MTVSLLIINLLYTWMAYITSKAVEQYYIGKNGFDNHICGNTETNPCGTLYFVSLFVNNSSNSKFIINVMVGQNETEILAYQKLNNTNNYDPCLPKPFDYSKQITLTFQNSSLSNWFPQDICDQNNTIYANEYMFDGGSIHINNLIINDYTTMKANNLYGIIRGVKCKCNGCRFQNILSTNKNNPLFYTMSDIYLFNNKFIDIYSPINLIFANHNNQANQPRRYIVFNRTSFINVITEESILYMSSSVTDYNNGAEMTIHNGTFQNISNQNSIITDHTYGCNIKISDTSLNINFGGAYYSQHKYQSEIRIYNTLILSNQLNTFNKDGLLYFSSSDTTAIHNLYIKYSYNTHSSCQMLANISNSVINASCSLYQCINPVPAIYNLGKMNMDHITIDMDIHNYNTNDSFSISKVHFKRFMYYQGFPRDVALITNANQMTITNIFISKTISKHVLLNEGILSIFNLSFDLNINYDPNILQSENIIYQTGGEPSLIIYNSHFIGSFWQIQLIAGKATIFQSIFENSSQAISTQDIDEFIMSDCMIKNNGQYNGPFLSDRYVNSYATSGILIWENSNNINISNNYFFGYDPKGLLTINKTSNISLNNNIFIINTQHLFYDIPDQQLIFKHSFSTLNIQLCSNTTITGNYFEQNTLDKTPWINYHQNPGINCLSSNTFTNYAFHAYFTDITSCARLNILDNINSYLNTSHTYGPIDELLFDKKSDFMVHITGYVLFTLNNSNAALDNVNITVINTNQTTNTQNSNPIIISMNDSKLLLVDSYITNTDNISYDISYYSHLCNVTYNERLESNIQIISQLLIHCIPEDNNIPYSLNKTMNSVNTKLVTHLTLTKINLTTNPIYYPGQLLPFKYNLTDRIGNIIHDNSHIKILIMTQNDRTELDINNEECPICETGILFNAISVQNVGDVYPIHIYVENKILIPELEIINLSIIGCPTMKGPEVNNYTCVECNNNYYNLETNNVNQCMSCDSDKNIGVKCMNGNINIRHNGYMRIDKNGIISSSICPPSMCCQNINGCNYNDNNTHELCGLNRNYNSLLCSKCIAGNSELILSSYCGKCNDYHTVWLMWFVIAIIWILYILISKSEPIPDHEQSPKNDTTCCDTLQCCVQKKCINCKYRIKQWINCMHNNCIIIKENKTTHMLQIMIMKCVLYYEQSISQIFLNSTIDIDLKYTSIFNFFNLSIFGESASSDKQYC
eukprot:484023_1